MRRLKFLLQKEFRQIFRDPAILRVIFIIPVMQLVMLPFAANYEVRRIKLSIIDHDGGSYARELVNKIKSSGYFQLQAYTYVYEKAFPAIEQQKADMLMEIPFHFEKDLVRENEAKVFIATNAINGVKAGLGTSYLQSIIRDYNGEIRERWIQSPRLSPEIMLDIRSSNWYNPHMNYKLFMVPAILVLLITIMGSFLTAMNIVREKEIGTIEQINVTPIRKYQFILGKLIPFWVIGLIILTIGLFIAWLFYGIVPEGSYFTIYLFTAVYLLGILGFGLLVSTYASSQHQAILITFFIFIVFVLLGGVYTPLESMPLWAQWFTKLNPVAYFVEVMRMVVLKGSGLPEVHSHLFVLLGFAVVFNGWATLNYRKRSA